jgi:hypothetical protein
MILVRLASKALAMGTRFCLLLMLLVSLVGTPVSGAKSLASRKVRHYQVSAINVWYAIADAAATLGVPIGCEIISYPEEPVSIDVSNVTVGEVFSAILQHAPDYRLIEENGVIDVRPKEKSIGILDLKISHFAIHEITDAEIRLVIDSLPEVKAWMSQNHVSDRTSFAGVFPVGGDVPRISLERRDETLRDILNSLLLLKRGPRSWGIVLFGEANQFLDIAIR